MEEADARLQEVVASLLNEHGGSHEQALRQTFACLHNSGLYEAQSAAEEEQREQQVRSLIVFACCERFKKCIQRARPVAEEGHWAGCSTGESLPRRPRTTPRP